MKQLKSHKSFNGKTEFYEHDSKQTGTPMKFSVYLPDTTVKGGLIWLSGLTCNEENFITKAGAQKYLSDRGLAIICPDTSPRGLDLPQEHDDYDFGSGAGFYIDAQTEGYSKHYKMESYIADEILNLFNNEFNKSGKTALFGHSMGGHGALTLGLKYPERFTSVSAFSPITNPVNCQWGQKAFAGYLGDDKDEWQKHDATCLIESGKSHPRPFLIEQGLDDNFYPDQLLTENFEKACGSSQQEVIINKRPGFDHSYYFISTFVEDHIRFHDEFLNS